MRFLRIGLVLLLLLAPAVPASAQGGQARLLQCLRVMNDAMAQPGSHIVLPYGCGSIDRHTTFVRAENTGYACEYQEGSLLGQTMWKVQVCEQWGWDGQKITWMDNPPSDHSCWAIAAYECTSNSYGTNWINQPWSAKAWDSAQLKFSLGIYIGTKTVTENLWFYGDGNVAGY